MTEREFERSLAELRANLRKSLNQQSWYDEPDVATDKTAPIRRLLKYLAIWTFWLTMLVALSLFLHALE